MKPSVGMPLTGKLSVSITVGNTRGVKHPCWRVSFPGLRIPKARHQKLGCGVHIPPAKRRTFFHREKAREGNRPPVLRSRAFAGAHVELDFPTVAILFGDR